MIEKNKVYKLKQGITLDPKDYFSKFVYVLDIVQDIETRKEICVFKHIFLEDKSFVNNLDASSSLPVDKFIQYFELSK